MRSFLPALLFFGIFLFPFSGSSQESLEELGMITREEWNALPPAKEMIRQVPTKITIHHTGTNQNFDKSTEEKLRDLQKFSFSEGFLGNGMPKKPWADVPYHYYIAADGSLAEGRKIGFEGDSNTDYDLTGHLLIVLEGNFDKIELPPVQREKLEKLVAIVAKKWHIPAEKISGHKDQAVTSCPGENLYAFLPVLREQQKKRDENRVIIGAEKLLTPEFIDLVKGKRVGLVTNHTGVLPNGQHLIDLLNNSPDVELTLLFGPEHGLRGEADAQVANGIDPETGLPIISLYGKLRKPTPEMLEKVDVLVFDIQDIGARYYTYIKTMLNVLEAAAEAEIPFMVLDRPNPISGAKVEGPIGKALDAKNGIGNIPVTHGMTVGELALLFNSERREKGLPVADLHVVPMENYSRSQFYDQTGLPWIKPSPNMLFLSTAIVYPATCLLEGTNISEARGTMSPFEHFGATWINSEELAKQLNSYNLGGVEFQPITFKPDSIVDGIKIHPPKFLGEKVNGVEMIVTNREAFEPLAAGIFILHAFHTLYPEKMEWRKERMDGLLGTSEVREKLQAGISPKEIIQDWQEDEEKFRKIREEFLLYQ